MCKILSCVEGKSKIITVFYSLLLLAVWYGEIKGDDACYLQGGKGCSYDVKKKALCFLLKGRACVQPLIEEDEVVMCRNRQAIFACLRKSARECSVDQRYNFDKHEEVYKAFCTNGTEEYLMFQRNKDCLRNNFHEADTICNGVVNEFQSDIEVWTADLVFELLLLVCRERPNNEKCLLAFYERSCGEEAKQAFKLTMAGYGVVEEKVCEDVLIE